MAPCPSLVATFDFLDWTSMAGVKYLDDVGRRAVLNVEKKPTHFPKRFIMLGVSLAD